MPRNMAHPPSPSLTTMLADHAQGFQHIGAAQYLCESTAGGSNTVPKIICYLHVALGSD